MSNAPAKTLKFETFTKRFVTLKTYQQGTTAYGYADTLENAVRDAGNDDIFGAIANIIAYERTDKLTRGKRPMSIYVLI